MININYVIEQIFSSYCYKLKTQKKNCNVYNLLSLTIVVRRVN